MANSSNDITLHDIVAHITAFKQDVNRRFDRLETDLSNFRSEMYEFRDEMYEFKEDTKFRFERLYVKQVEMAGRIERLEDKVGITHN